MHWFYVPNEGKEGGRIGTRMAFEKLWTMTLFQPTPLICSVRA